MWRLLLLDPLVPCASFLNKLLHRSEIDGSLFSAEARVAPWRAHQAICAHGALYLAGKFPLSRLVATSLPLNQGICFAMTGRPTFQEFFTKGWISIMGLPLQGGTTTKVGLLSLKTACSTNRWNAQ